MKKVLVVVGISVFAIMLIAVASSSGNRNNTSSPQPYPYPSTSSQPTQAPAPIPTQSNTIDDGTFTVGDEIQPGTYKTPGPQEGMFQLCSWSRLRDTSGDPNSLITIGTSQGQATVTIKPSDGAFQTTGCQTWVKTR